MRAGRAARAAGVVLVLAGVAVVATLGLRAHHADSKLAAIEGAEAAPGPARALPPPRDGRPRLVFLGDSRIARWPAALTPRDSHQVWLAGIGGETTPALRARARARMADLDPDILVVQGGINDLVAAGLNPGRAEALARAVPANLGAVAETALAAGARLVVLTTVVRPARPPLWRRPFWSVRIPALVDEVNAEIRGLGRPPDIEILDADRILAGPDGAPLGDRYARDTLHWHDSAYRRLADALEERL